MREGDKALRNKRYASAIASYTAALDATRDARIAAHLYDVRAYAHLEAGNFANALSDANEAIKRAPTFARAYLNRAVAYRGMGALERTLDDLNHAIRFKPDYALAFYNRGFLHGMKRNYREAREDFSRAIQLEPSFGEAYLARGYANYALGNYRAAVSDTARAAALHPNNVVVLNKLAWLKATSPDPAVRNGQEAVRIALKACRLTNWKSSDPLDVLAAAHAEAGDFEKAVSYQEQALKTKGVSKEWREEMRKHLASYRARRPYRDLLHVPARDD